MNFAFLRELPFNEILSTFHYFRLSFVPITYTPYQQCGLLKQSVRFKSS
jgi:hypothetical protein